MSRVAYYIRKRDARKFKKSEYDYKSYEAAVLLLKYKGSKATATKKKVPLFDRRGNYQKNLD